MQKNINVGLAFVAAAALLLALFAAFNVGNVPEARGTQNFGAATFGGAVNASRGITVTENISAGTGLQAAGDSIFWSDLTVDDDFYVDGNADLDGALDVDDNTDLDDTQVDGEFEVTGTSILTGEVTTGGDMTIGDDLEVTDDLTVNGDLYVTGYQWITATTMITGNTSVAGGITATENISAGTGIQAGGASYFWDNLGVEDDLDVGGNTDLDDTQVDGEFEVTGTSLLTGTVTAVGNVLVGDWLVAIEQTACVVFAGSSITPTGMYQPITSEAVVTTSTSIAIVDGVTIGQLLILINENAADAITVDDGGNTRLSGDAVLGPDDTLMLIWDGADWVEIAQANNT